jgi:hypothetical protein
MKHTTQSDHDDAPIRQPGVELAVRQLERQLCELLGSNTEYCLVVSQETEDLQRIQAITNAPVARAHQLLRVMDEIGFNTLN